MSILKGDEFMDLRYDPIDRELRIEEVVGTDGPGNGEVHTVEAIPGLPGKYGFSPIEMPYKDLDLPNNGVSILEVDEDNEPTGGPAMTLVIPPVGDDPGTNEFFVDFNNPEPYLNTGRFLFNPAKEGTRYRISYKCIGGLNSAKNVSRIQQSVIDEAFAVNSPLQGILKSLNKKNCAWNGVTVNLNAGVYQINNLDILGTVLLRSTDTNSEAILEVVGTTTFAAGAILETYKVKLVFLGPVIGDATTPGIVRSPNGANGGNGTTGTPESGNPGGGGGAGAGGGGGGGGSTGGTGGAPGIGGSLGAGGTPNGATSGSNGITELGGGNNGGPGIAGFLRSGGAGGQGAGGGGAGAGLSAASGGSGGAISEILWVSAGGNGGNVPDGAGNAGAGGGGGGLWIKALFLNSISNIIFRPGKGGTGGNGVDDQRRGNGGQTGSVRIFLRKDLIANVTVDVSAGTSTGNTKRDGTAGDIHVHDIVTGEKTTVWPPSWSLTQDRRANVLGFLNESGYYTKLSVNSL